MNTFRPSHAIIATMLLAGLSTVGYAADNSNSVEAVAIEADDSLSTDIDITSQLKAESKGTSRARFGFYGAVGGQGAIQSDISPKIRGFLLDAGAYTLVNPIKKFADIEVGASFKYNTGASLQNQEKGETRYYNGLQQVSAYAGPVFQFGGGQHAVGLGVSKAFYLGEVKGDSNDKTPKNDLSNGLGAYVEYQWAGQPTASSRKTIPFARLTVEKFDTEIAQTKKQIDQTVVGVVFGAKY